MSSLSYQNLDESKAFEKLQTISPWDVTQLSPQRLRENIVPAGGEMRYCFGAKAVDDSTLRLLSDLAREQQCIEKYLALARGEVMNTGEKRMVLHHLTRGVLDQEVSHDGKNLREFYEAQRKRFGEFARSVQSGAVTAPSGKRFASVVQIGIGGSDLGALTLERGVIPPTINLDNPAEGCDLDFVPHTARRATVDCAMSNSFGFGGTNATIVLCKHPA